MNILEIYNTMRADVQNAFESSNHWHGISKLVQNFIPFSSKTNGIIWLHNGVNAFWNESGTPNEAFSKLLEAANNLENETPLKLNNLDHIVYIWIPSISQLKIDKSEAKELAPMYLITKCNGSKATNENILVWEWNEQPISLYQIGIYKWGACFQQTKDVNWLIIHLLRTIKIDF